MWFNPIGSNAIKPINTPKLPSSSYRPDQPSEPADGVSFYMEFIDNINKTLKEDMSVTLRSGSKVAIAASCFSIYAFQELKEQLSNISELRFIFTSPSFITEKADKQKREYKSYWSRIRRPKRRHNKIYPNLSTIIWSPNK